MNMEMASTQGSYYEMSCMGPQLLETAGCLNISIEHLS